LVLQWSSAESASSRRPTPPATIVFFICSYATHWCNVNTFKLRTGDVVTDH
jgi:hypothetical protein